MELSFRAAACLAVVLGAFVFLGLAAGWLFVGITLILAAEYRTQLLRLAERGLGREQKIRNTMALLAIGLLSVFAFYYVKGMFYNKPFPLNTFLPGPIHRFCDFYGTHDEWTRFRFKGIGYGLSYFPSTYLFVEPFRWIATPQRGVAVLLALFTLFTANYAFRNLRSGNHLETTKNVALCLMSYPFLFVFHTANLEIIVFLSLILFLSLYRQQHSPWLTSLLLAIPLSMKVFPGVFLVLFLSDRRYKEIFYTLAWVAVLSLLPLVIFPGGIRSGFAGYWSRLQASQNMYKQLMIVGIPGTHYGHSLLCALRVLFPRKLAPEAIPGLMGPYLAFTMVIFAGVVTYLLRCERTFWKKIALLVVSMNLLPYTSTDYKLIHFFIPFFLFVNAPKEEKYDLSFVVLFALLFLPKTIITFNGWPYHTLNQVMNPLLMIWMGGLIIVPGLLQRRASLPDGDSETPSEIEAKDHLLLPMPNAGFAPDDRLQAS